MVYDYIETQIGKVYVVMSKVGLVRVEVIEDNWSNFIKNNPSVYRNKETCVEAINQIDEYFKGERKEFNLPIIIEGTIFRKEVWKALMEIPYGETRSYSYIAEEINNKKAVRAIGQANKANLFPIIIPCHRVIGKNNKLVGYVGDNTDIQFKLIELEKLFK